MDASETPAAVLDAQGLLCPLPVLRARKAMKELPAGALLQVLATDPGAVDDFRHFCEATGSTLLVSREDGGVLTFLIRKAG
jgi:tRNA 2-thiouridine synthesizing protein A